MKLLSLREHLGEKSLTSHYVFMKIMEFPKISVKTSQVTRHIRKDKQYQKHSIQTFSWTMATYGRIIKTSFCLQSNSWRIIISATSVFPPLVGNEYIKFFLCCRDSNIKQSCCHSAKLKKNH